MADRARVLVVSPDFPPARGGIQVLMHRLVQNWRRVEPVVVTLSARGSAAFDREQDFAVRRVRVPRSVGTRGAIVALVVRAALEVLRFRPHVILSGHIVVSPAAWLARRLLAVPYVQYLYCQEMRARPRLAAFAIRHASAVVVISSYTESLALGLGTDPRRLHRILPGVDFTDEQPRNERFDDPTIAIVARLEDRHKGHDVLLRALPLLRARVPEARVVVVGDGRLRPAHESLARAVGVADAVEFRGGVGDAERDELLARAAVFAMPSRLSPSGGGEGFGIAYLEAGVHGVPVVGGNVGGSLDAVVDGVTGVLVDPSDHVAVADALADLLLDPPHATAMGAAGRAHARRHDWPSAARKVEDLLLTRVTR